VNRRFPLAVIICVLSFTAFSIFSQRSSANHSILQQSNQQDAKSQPQTIEHRRDEIILDEKGNPTSSKEPAGDELQFVPGEVLVKFKHEKDANDLVRGRRTGPGLLQMSAAPDLNKLFARFGVTDAKKPFERGARKSLPRIVKLTSASARDSREHTKALVAALRQRPEVEYAELNFIVHTQTAPNDAYYSTTGSWGQTFRDLWGLQSINAEPAWDTTQGDNVVVAVVDTGLDYNHEDIAGNVWENDGETGLDGSGNDKKANGLDDDGNGLIDDWRGWDFVTIDGTPGDKDPMDNFGHGTHVAGTIAATGNNGLGIIGVAPHAKIMALKGLDQYGSGSIEDLSNAIIYAADEGAQVINNSWGGSGETPQTLIDAVAYAHDVKGAVVVAAAGNSNWDVGTEVNGFYPACIRNVIAVSAISSTNAKASFSNYGAKIDVAAPGGGDTDSTGLIVQPDRSVLSLLSSAASSTMTGSGQLVVGGKYLRQAGTSMASPHVAGAAALVRALHPEFTNEQVRQSLKQSADDIGATGVDNQFGSGRINASRSLTVATPLAAQLSGPVGKLSGLAQVDVTGSVGGTGLSFWRLEYGAGTAPSSWTQIATSTNSVMSGVLANWNLSSVNDGTYTLHLLAQNSTGQVFEDRLTVILDGLVITDPSPLKVNITRGGGLVTISGTCAAANFYRYGIGIFGVNSNTWISNANIVMPNDGYQPVHNGLLGTWNTASAPADSYIIYVTLIFNDSTSVYKSTKLIVDGSLHPGWPKDVGILGNGIAFYALTNHLDAYDIDGNGSKEILIGYDTKVSIIDHNGNQLPGWPQSIDPQNSGAHLQISPAVADLDNDGSPEIIAANDQSKTFIFRADGTLWPGWPKNLGSSFTNLAIDDLNGDGTKEIIVTTYGSVRIYDLNGVFFPGFPIFTNTSNTPPAIGDVDGDGQKEVVFATLTGPSKLYMIKANGTVMPGWPRSINPLLASNFVAFSNPVLGDLDGDGKLECVIGSNDGQVYALRYDGSNQPGWPRATKPVQVNSPVIGDIDGDGLPEVVAGNDKYLENGQWTNYLFAWHADGTPLPNWPVKYDKQIGGTSFGFGAPALADLDQDGRADIIVSSDSSYPQAFSLNAYKSDGTKVAGFPKPTLDNGAFVTNTVAVADFDNDGQLEVAWIDRANQLYMWDTSAPSTAVAPWPMFQRDAAHTARAIITPETLAPTVSISSPVNGARVAGAATITVQASDNVGVTSVELYKDGVLVGALTSAPYDFSWDTAAGADGNYSFTSKAYDAAGNIGTSPAVLVTVDNTAPTASISSPANGSVVTGASVAISANAADASGIQKVDFYRDGGQLIGTDTSAPYSVSWSLSGVSNDSHNLYVVATDMTGNSAASAGVSVVVDNAPPAVAITTPASGAKVGGTISVSANATDNVGISKVQFYRDSNVLLGTVLSPPFSINWNTTSVTAGAHTLYAVATDSSNLTATSATISVTVDNTLPTVTLTAPTSNALLHGAAVTMSATASDNIAVAKVDFYRDSNVLLGTDSTSPYSISWDSTTATSGGHTVYAVATDSAGNTKSSTVINVTVDNTGPTVSLTAPVNGAVVSGTAVTFSATASDNVAMSKVEFYRDNDVLLGSDTSSPYSFTFNSTTVTSGAHTLYAAGIDTAGNRTNSVAVSITVDNTAPTVSITSPLNGATVARNSTVNILANATDNVVVTKVEFYVNNSLKCTDTTAAYSCSWVPTQKTSYTLKAKAYDGQGNNTTHQITVTAQ
jgi:subtilisin family serine protease